MPQSLPLSSNPSLRKKHHSFQNKEKTKIKNCSKSPQSRERTRLGNCSLLLPHREEGRELRGNSAVDFHTQKWCLCVSGGHHPASSDTALKHHSHTPRAWGQARFSTKTAMVLLWGWHVWCAESWETPSLAGMGISLWSHWATRQAEFTIREKVHKVFLKGAVMLVDWERSGQIFCQNRNQSEKSSFNKTLCVCIHMKSYWFQWSFPWKTKLNFVHSRKILP